VHGTLSLVARLGVSCGVVGSRFIGLHTGLPWLSCGALYLQQVSVNGARGHRVSLPSAFGRLLLGAGAFGCRMYFIEIGPNHNPHCSHVVLFQLEAKSF
jgi:hypothetical protein